MADRYGSHPGGVAGTGTTTVVQQMGVVESLPAGEDLAGHRIVRLDAGSLYLADKDDPPALVAGVVGMTTGAAQSGQPAAFVRHGAVPGDAGLPERAVFWLGNIGTMTTSAPTTGVALAVAIARDSTTYHVRLGQPVLRA